MFYKKSENLDDLILWMQTEQNGVSIKDIMERYSISERTAIRMKDAVKKRFPNIQEIKSKRKFWFIPQQDGTKQIFYSLEEIAALQSAIKGLSKKMPEQSTILKGLLNKVKASLGKDKLKHIEPDAEALLEAEGYAFRPGPRIAVNKDHLNKLRLAIVACKRIRMKYNSVHNQNAREVWPYGFLYGNKHYLIAWEPGKNKMCYYNLNKIQEIEVIDEYFQRRTDFSLQDFSEQAFGVYQEEPFDVEWLFDKEVAASAEQYIFHPKQEVIKNANGTLTVKFRAGGAKEMDWHLYTWGKHVKVIKPSDFEQRKQGK